MEQLVRIVGIKDDLEIRRGWVLREVQSEEEAETQGEASQEGKDLKAQGSKK